MKMKKKILFLKSIFFTLILFIILSALSITVWAATPEIKIDASTTSATHGNDVMLYVKIDANPGFDSFIAKINYNSDIFAFKSCAGDLLINNSLVKNGEISSKVNVAYAGVTPVTDNGILYTITLTVKNDAPIGRTRFSFDEVTIESMKDGGTMLNATVLTPPTVNIIADETKFPAQNLFVYPPATGLTYGDILGEPSASATGLTASDFTYIYVGVVPTIYSSSSVKPQNAGTYKVIATVKGDRSVTGSGESAPFAIAPKALTNNMLRITNNVLTYTGAVLPMPNYIVTDGLLLSANDYNTAVVSPAEILNAGAYTLSVTGKNNYTGTSSGTFTVSRESNSNQSESKANQSEVMVTLNRTTAWTNDVGIRARAFGGSGQGAYIYTSSNPAIAEINATTGLITIRSVGSALITAIREADANYNESAVSAAAALTVTSDSNPAVPAATTTAAETTTIRVGGINGINSINGVDGVSDNGGNGNNPNLNTTTAAAGITITTSPTEPPVSPISPISPISPSDAEKLAQQYNEGYEGNEVTEGEITNTGITDIIVDTTIPLGPPPATGNNNTNNNNDVGYGNDADVWDIFNTTAGEAIIDSPAGGGLDILNTFTSPDAMIFTDNNATANNSAAAANSYSRTSPRTGDNFVLLLSLFAFAGVGGTTKVLLKKKAAKGCDRL